MLISAANAIPGWRTASTTRPITPWRNLSGHFGRKGTRKAGDRVPSSTLRDAVKVPSSQAKVQLLSTHSPDSMQPPCGRSCVCHCFAKVAYTLVLQLPDFCCNPFYVSYVVQLRFPMVAYSQRQWGLPCIHCGT